MNTKSSKIPLRGGGRKGKSIGGGEESVGGVASIGQAVCEGGKGEGPRGGRTAGRVIFNRKAGDEEKGGAQKKEGGDHKEGKN